MKSLMLSAVLAGLVLAGCDYGDPKLPFPDNTAEETGAPAGGGGGTTDVRPPDDAGVDAGVNDGGMGDGGVVSDGGITGTLAEVARSNPDLELFMRAVDKAGMMGALQDASATFTVFAPDNAAFAALLTELGLAEGLEGLNAEQLGAILRYHVLPTRVTANDAFAAAGQTRLEALGGRIDVAVERQMLQLDRRASVIKADLQASNGILHVIDRVLLPSAADVVTTYGTLKSFSAALARADEAMPGPGLLKRLDDDEQSLTVFAPNDRGFEKSAERFVLAGITSLESFRPAQLEPIVKYHVVEGATVADGLIPAGTLQSLGGTLKTGRAGTAIGIDDAAVSTADLFCSNGVIHVVNALLLPSITDVITTDERFRALSAAVGAADAEPTLTRSVGEALDSPNEFTFFAPSNAAFNALGPLPAGPVLSNVLFFHAVPGAPIYAARVVTFTEPTPVLTSIDQPLVLQASGTPPRVTVTGGPGAPASITQVDLFTANGVIHVIDRVLAPSP